MTASAFPDPWTTPEDERELLVVYAERRQADEARAALLRAGVPERDIRLDDEPDKIASLRAEMHDELVKAWVVPTAGVSYPSESARGLAWLSVLGAVFGLLVALPLALIPFGGSYGVRYLVWAVIGVAFGATVGLVAGPAMAAARPSLPPAAVRGTLLRVTHDTPEVRALLHDLEPLRMDEMTADDVPVDTITTERPTSRADVAKDMAEHASSDDYHPTEHDTPERAKPRANRRAS